MKVVNIPKHLRVGKDTIYLLLYLLPICFCHGRRLNCPCYKERVIFRFCDIDSEDGEFWWFDGFLECL